ncbi:MAG TPA: proline--tRNA ligase, partial [Buchnera sp. (in: enterobacteria)]|nr:proline--tRNA ligase [Buchnera sp. (in: enterobacteria)]
NSLQKTYYKIYKAYLRIFQRMKIHVKEIKADNGVMGGNISHEFHAMTNNGDNNIIFSERSYDTAILLNTEKTNYADLYKNSHNEKKNKTHFKTLLMQSSCLIDNSIKMILVKNNVNSFIGLLINHNYIINKTKLAKLKIIAKPITLATKEEIYDLTGSNPEFIGPIGLDIPLIADRSVIQMKNFVIGANINNKYFYNINWKEDLQLPEIADITNIISNNSYYNKIEKFYIKQSIEIGHIFQLEKKYSKKINAMFLTHNGDNKFLHMGCYGIGITRIIAAIIEQNYDNKGIIWNSLLAPFQVAILPINLQQSITVKNISESLYLKLQENNIEVIFDDRNLRPGVMFSEIELIGIPHCIIISERNIKNNNIEYKSRMNNDNQIIPINNIINFLVNKISKNSEQEPVCCTI